MDSNELLGRLMDTQEEQTKILVRMETKLECLPQLQQDVDDLKQKGRDQETTIKVLKWVGGLALTVFSYVIAFVKN